MRSPGNARAPDFTVRATDLKMGLLLFALALGIRAVAMVLTGFDGLYGQDPFAYLSYAEALERALASFESPPPFFWPIGYPLLVALAVKIAGNGAQAAQWVSVVAGAAIAPFVYAMVCALRPRAWRGALVASLLAATAPQLLISSLSIMSDAAGLAWITLSAWALVRYQSRIGVGAAGPSPASGRGTLGLLTLSAFALGMSILTRWVYVGAGPVWGVSTLLAWHELRLPMHHRIAGSITALAVVVLVVGSQFVGDVGRGDLSHLGDLHVAGWNPLDAFRSTLTNSDGTFQYDWPVGIFYALPLIHPSFVFPLLSPFVWLGAVEIGRGIRSVSALVIGWPLVMYLYLAGRAWENPRFSLGLFPPLLILLGIGFERAVGSTQAKWRNAAIACAVLGIMGSVLWNVRTVGRFVAVKEAQLDTVRWVEHATRDETTIASFGLNDTLQHYTARRVLNLYALDPAALEALIASASLQYLLIDPDNVEEQWRGKSPALNVAWLRNHTTLTEVGRQSPWVLFKIDPRGS